MPTELHERLIKKGENYIGGRWKRTSFRKTVLWTIKNKTLLTARNNSIEAIQDIEFFINKIVPDSYQIRPEEKIIITIEAGALFRKVCGEPDRKDTYCDLFWSLDALEWMIYICHVPYENNVPTLLNICGMAYNHPFLLNRRVIKKRDRRVYFDYNKLSSSDRSRIEKKWIDCGPILKGAEDFELLDI